MIGFLKRLAVLLGVVPAMFLEVGYWVATGRFGNHVMRLAKWGGILD